MPVLENLLRHCIRMMSNSQTILLISALIHPLYGSDDFQEPLGRDWRLIWVCARHSWRPYPTLSPSRKQLCVFPLWTYQTHLNHRTSVCLCPLSHPLSYAPFQRDKRSLQKTCLKECLWPSAFLLHTDSRTFFSCLSFKQIVSSIALELEGFCPFYYCC